MPPLNRFHRTARRLMALSGLFVVAVATQAAVISVTATGRIVYLSHPFTTQFAEGQTFTYTFSYESTATPTVQQGTVRTIPMINAALAINSTPVWQNGPTDGITLSIINGNGTQTDRIAAVATIAAPTVAGTGVYSGTYTPAGMGMELYAPSTRLTDTSVPTSYALSDWNPYALVAGSNVFVQFRNSGGALFTVRGEITTLTSTGGPQPGAPTITASASGRIINVGATTTLTVVASGAGNTYQWRKDGAAITQTNVSGINTPALTITAATTANAGTYTLVVTNAQGTVTSPPVPVGVVPASNAGRLVNLSVRTNAGTGDNTLIVGVGIGGAGTSGDTRVLLRGVGPALTAFGVPGALADPVMAVFSGQTQIESNDDWAGGFDFASVGAFAFPANSRDAAIYADEASAGSYSIQITGKGGTTGVALAEIYDATPASAFTAATPRLINVSARTHVGTGDNILIVGFAVGGSSPVRLLVRAVGPGLAAFGVGGTLTDPKLEIYAGSNKIEENDNWLAADASAFSAVGAFGLIANSRDAAVVVTLSPGTYTTQVSGVGATTGVALVELYQLP